jgi:HTH-type transcriptional regulator/antitoxin HigA
MNTFKPDYAIHPGAYLAEILESREIKKNDFARRAGISPKAVSQIINGKALYSSELALVFERVLGVDARLWMNLASSWQLFQTERKEERKLANEATKTWLKRFPVADLRKLGIVPNTRKPQELAEAILRFLGVSSPESCSEWISSRAVAFRKSSAYNESNEATSIWLKLAEIRSATQDIPMYNRETFKKHLSDVRNLTRASFPGAIDRLQEICAKSGVYFVIIPKLSGIRLSGASWWLGNDRPMLAFSLRYGTNDHFWFTFFHEAAHILLHGKKGIFLDSQDDNDAPDEQEADTFARNSLIALGSWNSFIAGANFYEPAIKAFAASQGVHPAIVVGRLQHESRIEKSWHNGLKESIALPNL